MVHWHLEHDGNPIQSTKTKWDEYRIPNAIDELAKNAHLNSLMGWFVWGWDALKRCHACVRVKIAMISLVIKIDFNLGGPCHPHQPPIMFMRNVGHGWIGWWENKFHKELPRRSSVHGLLIFVIIMLVSFPNGWKKVPLQCKHTLRERGTSRNAPRLWPQWCGGGGARSANKLLSAHCVNERCRGAWALTTDHILSPIELQRSCQQPGLKFLDFGTFSKCDSLVVSGPSQANLKSLLLSRWAHHQHHSWWCRVMGHERRKERWQRQFRDH